MPWGGRALLLALVLGGACIDKPGLPSDRIDGGPGDGDDGGMAGDAGPCGAALGSPTAWADDDQIRFDRDQGKINTDCLDDLVIPGVRGAANGVFVVLGRSQEMLVGGYDGFVDTSERIPVDVKLSKLVGDDELLDLIVLSTGQTDLGDPATAIRIYQGKGDGTFQATFVEKEVEGLELVVGDFDSPEPLYIDTLQMDASKPPSLIFGDAAITRTLSPSTWDDNDTVAATVEEPLVSDGETTTDCWPIPRTDAVDDLVRLTQGEMSWYANQAPATYSGPTVIENPQPGVGRATLGIVDLEDDDPDLTYSRNDQVWVTRLIPAANGETGAADKREVDPDPEFGNDLDFAFEDIQVAQLDGDDTAGDLILVSAVPDGGSFLWVYPNLEASGAFMVNASVGIEVDAFPSVADAMPNRAFVGNFSDPTEVDIWVVGSKPAENTPVCVRVDVFPDETAQRICP